MVCLSKTVSYREQTLLTPRILSRTMDNTYSALNDDTHHLGYTLEQHDLQDANGNTVTVTETTNGDYYFQDENGTGFTDNGDGTWSDENGSSYTEID